MDGLRAVAVVVVFLFSSAVFVLILLGRCQALSIPCRISSSTSPTWNRRIPLVCPGLLIVEVRIKPSQANRPSCAGPMPKVSLKYFARAHSGPGELMAFVGFLVITPRTMD